MDDDVAVDATLDASVLAELREFAGPEDASMVGRLVSLFLEEARGHLRELNAAADARDTVRVARAAHQLCGSAGFVGAIGLKRLCAEIERSAEHGILAGLDDRLGRLDRALDLLSPRLLAIAATTGSDMSQLVRTA
jgi:HPt (histidine-containing phosphotransfer) domain-containing protein